MTLKALMNFGYEPAAPPYRPPMMPVDRGHHSHHGWHGSGGSKGGHGSSAALSALSLLAFLFFLNVMQQSLQENNATETTTGMTIFLRESDPPGISLTARKDQSHSEETTEAPSTTSTTPMTTTREPSRNENPYKYRRPPSSFDDRFDRF